MALSGSIVDPLGSLASLSLQYVVSLAKKFTRSRYGFRSRVLVALNCIDKAELIAASSGCLESIVAERKKRPGGVNDPHRVLPGAS